MTSRLDEATLRRWGRSLGRALREAPIFVALDGPLGAGKTTLVQAACVGLGVTQPVTSPTFTLVNRYETPGGPVLHADLYRIEKPDELAELGWDDLVRGEVPVLVEWAGRARAALPPDRWEISLGIADGGATRTVEAQAVGRAPDVPPAPSGSGAARVAPAAESDAC